MAEKPAAKASAYDKYVDYKRFAIAVALFVIILIFPMPGSMLDVAVEYTVGETYVQDFYSQELFGKPHKDVEQWQKLTVEALEGCMLQGVSRKENVLKRKAGDLKRMGVTGHEEHIQKFRPSWRDMTTRPFLI